MSYEHDQQIIASKVRRLKELERQHAYQGIQTPPHITMEMEDLRVEIAHIQYHRSQLIFQANDLALEPPPLAQALILLISPLRPGDALHTHSAYQAIDYHRATLQHCWLIATDGAQPTAEALAKHFGVYRVPCTIKQITNGADLSKTQELVAAIYTEITQAGQLKPTDVIADITGGSKVMTAGMALACGTTWPMQWMLHQPGLPSLPVLLHHYTAEQPT